jgi:hypothetical protein
MQAAGDRAFYTGREEDSEKRRVNQNFLSLQTSSTTYKGTVLLYEFPVVIMG